MKRSTTQFAALNASQHHLIIRVIELTYFRLSEACTFTSKGLNFPQTNRLVIMIKMSRYKTNADLRRLLEQRNLPTTGKKAELVARLTAYDYDQ